MAIGGLLVTEDRATYQASGELEPDRYYSPSRLDYLVHHWDLLRSRAERIGSTSEVRVRVQGGGGTDPDHSKRIMGDVLRAVRALGDTREHLLVCLVIWGRWPEERTSFSRDRDWQGYVVRQAGGRLHLCPMAASLMYRECLRRMARALGWRAADEAS